ncbi:hypothetical protein ABG067_002031 [Albugo candida]
MSKAASLDKSVINLNVLREDACRELFSILDSIGKDICFVLDPELSGPLNHILVDGISVLKKYGVKDFYAFGKPIKTTCDHVLFLIRPSLRGMRYIAKYVRDAGPNKHYYLYFVSCRTLVCDEILKKESVLGNLTIGEFKLDLIPFDDDLLTLELECCFKQFFIEKDKSNLQPITNSIIKLQTIFGMIPNIKYKGSISKIVYDQVAQFKREQEIVGNPVGILDPEIETLILIDRTVDLVTPLTTPMTYEGLLDEIMGISNGFITVDADLVADEDSTSQTTSPSGEKKQVAVPLNSNDELYAQVRDYHVERLGMYLQQQAQSIRERYDIFRKNRDASISEIREFVKRIPGLKQSYQSLQQHINLAELIKKTADHKSFRDLKAAEHAMLTGETIFDQLEERIGFQEPLISILRQLCLQSVTSGGIKAKQYDYIRRELIQTYGFQVLPALNNLEKAGLLRRRDTLWNEASGFSSARKSLRLIQEEVNLRDPKSIAYVSQSHAFGYAPLSVRLVESILKTKSWSSIQEALRQLPGPMGEMSQISTSKSDRENPIMTAQSSKLDSFGSPEDRKVLLVFFIGGVTFMEIAALRFLSNQINSPYDIIIATTKITNGNHLIRSCLDKEVSKILSV